MTNMDIWIPLVVLLAFIAIYAIGLLEGKESETTKDWSMKRVSRLKKIEDYLGISEVKEDR